MANKSAYSEVDTLKELLTKFETKTYEKFDQISNKLEIIDDRYGKVIADQRVIMERQKTNKEIFLDKIKTTFTVIESVRDDLDDFKKEEFSKLSTKVSNNETYIKEQKAQTRLLITIGSVVGIGGIINIAQFIITNGILG